MPCPPFHATPQVQLQLLTAIVKLFLKRPSDTQELVQNVLSLATQDSDNPDLRDRGYIYWRLLSTDPAAAKVQLQTPICFTLFKSHEASPPPPPPLTHICTLTQKAVHPTHSTLLLWCRLCFAHLVLTRTIKCIHVCYKPITNPAVISTGSWLTDLLFVGWLVIGLTGL